MNPDLTVAERLWRRDGTLWSTDPKVVEFIQGFMGWTDIARRMKPQVRDLRIFAETIWAEGFTDVLVCGMGGSSLGSLVLRDLFSATGRMHVHVLDSTDPETVLSFRKSLTLESTLFLVASKSGNTVEPKSFEDYFWAEAQAVLGATAPEHFVAITDPGSDMEKESIRRGYRHIFLGDATIGGRFSVLSVFGLVTAALIGVDLDQLLDSAIALEAGSALEIGHHPGFLLGQFFVEALAQHKDKICLLNAPGLESFGLWVEQLVAESTGKDGKGILPIATEPLGGIEHYGQDRVFVCTRWDDSRGAQMAHLVQALAANGHPTFERVLQAPEDIGAEFLTWEVATAVVAAALKVNPFDQPDVQRAKEIAKEKLAEIKAGSRGGPKKATKFALEGAHDLSDFLAGEPDGMYVAFLGYLPESELATQEFDRLRGDVRDALGFVTSFGYGPRYLHSTGQYHKGGPDNGLFVLVLASDEKDVEIPDAGVTFGQLKRAQALGDLEALKRAGRKVLFVECRNASDLANLSI